MFTIDKKALDLSKGKPGKAAWKALSDDFELSIHLDKKGHDCGSEEPHRASQHHKFAPKEVKEAVAMAAAAAALDTTQEETAETEPVVAETPAAAELQGEAEPAAQPEPAATEAEQPEAGDKEDEPWNWASEEEGAKDEEPESPGQVEIETK